MQNFKKNSFVFSQEYAQPCRKMNNLENDIIRETKVPWELFHLSNESEEISEAFYCLHMFDISNNFKTCETCKDQDFFLRYHCFCSFCTTFNEEMANDPINDYVLHCFQCRKCLCKSSPETCLGCALIAALRTKSMTFVASFLHAKEGSDKQYDEQCDEQSE